MRIVDQFGRSVVLPNRPERIVSLCPSQTETLAALVAPERMVGCTTYCRHPEALIFGLRKVGGTKRLDLPAIAALQPDLIVSVREENSEEEVRGLARMFPTLILDPVDHRTASEGLRLLGLAVGEPERADVLAGEVEAVLAGLEQAGGQRVLYLIWRKPYMAAGSGTFIDGMLRALGFQNAAGALPGRYPTLDAEAVTQAAADVVLAASEPFPFEEKHCAELQARFSGCQIHLVDGEAFGWHGVRTIHARSTLDAVVRKVRARAG